MRPLAAEQPEGFGVVDHDGEDGDLALGNAGGGRLERGVDTGNAGVDGGDGDTRIVKV